MSHYTTGVLHSQALSEKSVKLLTETFQPMSAIGMGQNTKTLLRTLDGVETSRRVGWAKFYELRDENEELRWLVKRLAESVLRNNRLNNSDPTVVLATELIKSV